MDNRKAREELQTLRDSITQVLGEKSSAIDSSDISDSIKEAQSSAREGAKALKKSLIDRIKDLPVVTQVSQLGAAGTVAVSTAAVTQVDIAQTRTEIFVAEVANDVVEERFEIPQFFETVIDFQALNVWGQDVIAEQIAEATDFVESVETKVEASSQQSTSESSSSAGDTTPESSSSSQDTSDDTPSDTESQESESETESTEQETEAEESKSSEESKEGDSETKSEDTQEQSQEQETEPQQESQDSNESSSQPTESSDPVKTSVETPVDNIKPHDMVISPTL